jgi:glutamyl-Q tRNA(Asp) synthetase
VARYPGTCRDRRLPPGDAAIRVRVERGRLVVDDALQGEIETDLSKTLGDYVIVRRDGLPAYHLAVVLDDAAQGVTDVVRGVDLLDSTAAHVHLQNVLDLPQPRYWHVPVVVNSAGQKLSKQTGAAAVDPTAGQTAAGVLRLLGASVPFELQRERPQALWQWAAQSLDFARLRGVRTIAERAPD